MNERDTIFAIHAETHDAQGRPGRCLDVARGRTILERTAGLSKDNPRVAGVFVLAPVSGQAMTLGRMFKDKFPAGFQSLLGGRSMPTYKRLLEKHSARYLMILQGGNLLYSRDMVRQALETCSRENKPVFFDNGHGTPCAPSVLGRVDAAPAECVQRAATQSESTVPAGPRLFESLCRAAGMEPIRLIPDVQTLEELFKLNFDNRLFSAQSLAMAMCDSSVQRPMQESVDALFMDPDLFRTICDELSSVGRTFELELSHGGEPLLHPDVLPCIEHATTRGIRVSLFTNGIFLNEQKADTLCHCGLDSITVCIDALDQDTYFDLHRMPLGPVENNVLRLLKMRESTQKPLRVRVRFSINPTNQHEVHGFYKKWAPLVDEVIFEEQFEPNGKLMCRDISNATKRHACERFLRQPVLTHTGDVLMCRVPDAAKTLICGSIHERGVIGALTHHGTREMYAKKPAVRRGKPCSSCDLWRAETYPRNAPDPLIQTI